MLQHFLKETSNCSLSNEDFNKWTKVSEIDEEAVQERQYYQKRMNKKNRYWYEDAIQYSTADYEKDIAYLKNPNLIELKDSERAWWKE